MGNRAGRRVVVTGMGVLSPGAHGLEDFEKLLREGRSAIQCVPELQQLGFACQVGGVVDGVEELKARYFSEDDRLSMKANFVAYGSIAAVDAWKDAGYTVPEPLDDRVHWNCGVVMGTGAAGIDSAHSANEQLLAGRVRRLGSRSVEQFMMSGIAARVTGLLGLGGPAYANSSACATGTDAIVQCYRLIKDGYIEQMIAGGADTAAALQWGHFDAMRVLSARFNHAPAKASRPMSASAGGFVPAGGAGALLLESLESAQARGARIHAEVIAGQLNAGGHRMGGSMTAPNREGVRRCIRAAIAEAGIEPRAIDLISGHLTGTMADPIEIANWQEALATSTFPWVNSPKSMIGHTLGAAGAIETIASILQLKGQFVHASINCEDLHPKLESIAPRVPHVTCEADIQVVAKSSFGFGDVNAVALLRRWDAA